MKKLIILVAVMVVLAVAVVAMVDTCGDVISPGMSCTMLSPSLVCGGTYDYNISNSTGVVQSGILNGTGTPNIYSLQFNQSPGGYIVTLCDQSTREIQVGSTDSMSGVGIALIVGIIMFIMFYAGKRLIDENTAYTAWINHMLVLIGFACLPLIARLADAFAIDTYGAGSSIAALTNGLFIATAIITAIMFLFYTGMFVRYVYIALDDGFTRRNRRE